MMNLTEFQGVELNPQQSHRGDTYCSRSSAEELLDAVVAVITKNIQQEINDKDMFFFSIMIDESTDITI